MLEIALFGEPAFLVRGRPHAFVAPPKTLPLLTYLLLQRNTPVARELLAGLLWPDCDEETARGNLRRHLHYIRKALPEGDWLAVDRKSVQWKPDRPFRLDVAEFEQQSKIAEMLPVAVQLYRGDLFRSSDEEWLYFERERLRNMQIANLATLAQSAERSLDHITAAEYARQLLELEPWREDAVRILMRARMQTGDRAGAIAEFERFRARLAAEMGVVPMPETVRLFEAFARRGDPAPQLPRASALVGRDGELEALMVAWRSAANARGAVALVGGEAGIGKTALLRELADHVRHEGATVLSARMQPHEDAPYAAVATALGQAPIDTKLRAAAASKLPGMLPEAGQRGAFFASVAAALQSLAQRAPVLLWIDDLQWAGGDTVALIEFLERRLRDSKVLVVCSYREEGVGRDHPIRGLRRILATRPHCVHLALNALTLEQAMELARRRLGERVTGGAVQAAYRRTQGNPFFLTELLATAPAGGQPNVPTTIRELVDERYDSLTSGAGRFAARLAAFAAPLPASYAAALSGENETESTRLLDELLETRFLLEERTDAGVFYRFYHDVVRESLYDRLPVERRRRLHAEIAAVIERLSPDRHAAIAMHYERAGEERVAASSYLQAASVAVDCFANDDAERFARKALLLDDDPRVALRACGYLNVVYHRSGRRAEQLEALREMEKAAARTGDNADRAEAIYQRLGQAFNETDVSEMRAQLAALDDIAPSGVLWRGRIDAFGGSYDALCGKPEAAWTRLERAGSLCREAGRPIEELFCYVRLLEMCERSAKPFDELLNRARTLERRIGNDDATFLLAAAEANLFLHVDRAECVHSALRMMEAGERAGDQIYAGLAEMYLGAVAAYRFEPLLAEKHLSAAHRALDDSARRADLARLKRFDGLYHLNAGDVDAGIADSLLALHFAREAHAKDLVAFSAANAMYGYVLAGRIDEAEVLAAEASAEIEDLPPQYFGRNHLLLSIGILLEARGEYERAIDAIKAARDGFSVPGHELHVAWIDTSLASVLLRAGRPFEARPYIEEYLKDELSILDEGWMPQEMLWRAAQVLHEVHEPDRARSFLSRAAGVVATRTAALPDGEQQRRFARLPVNREILRAYSENVWPSYCVRTMS